MTTLPTEVFHDYDAPFLPVFVDPGNRPAKSPEPRYVMVEVGPEAIPELERHWHTGEPVELLGVVFEFAVVARTVRRWFRADRVIVRGVCLK